MAQVQDHQYVVDATGKRVAVILPIAEYEALVQRGEPIATVSPASERVSLFGALRHLGTLDVSDEEIDTARRELWGDWDKKEF